MINDSLDQVTTTGLLPYDAYAHTRCDDETQAPPRSNSTFSAKDLALAKRVGPESPFVGDEESWRHAFEFVHEFTAGSAARNKMTNWQLPHCLGPFAPRAGEIYEQLWFAFEQTGLRPITARNPSHKAAFETTETLAVKKLPNFYGLYLLARKSQKNPWDRNIDLRVQVGLAVEQRPGGAMASLALTAPVVSVVTAVEDFVAPFVAPAGSPAPGATHLLLTEIARRWGRPAPAP